MNLKAILLDVDNTLLDFNLCAQESLKEAMEQCGIAYEDGMYPVFERENNQIWKELEQGLLTREELHVQRFARVLRALHLEECADSTAVEDVFQKCVGESAVPVTGALELVQYLAEKYPLYVASNARQFRQVKRLEKAGMMPYIREVFSSEKMGANKPAREFFDGCFAAMEGIAPDECVIIGDSLSADIEGGKAYGMKTIWYNHDQLPVPENCIADDVVHSLDEIQNIL